MNHPINTCVLGVGLSGLTFHVPFLLALPESFNLYAVLERNPKTEGGKVFERFGVNVKIYRTFEDVLADSNIELIIIGTPNETHYEFAKLALQAGKHGGLSVQAFLVSLTATVLVDKPVTATSDQCRELGAISQEKKLVLYAFQNRRWDSDFLALKKLLQVPESSPKSLGVLTELESQYGGLF